MMRILIVEDLDETRDWLCDLAARALESAEVTAAATLKDGLAALQDRAFDLALVDLGLPDGSGLDLVRRLTASRPETPAIIMTVLGEDTHVVAALAAGAQGYLLKDSPEDLLARQLVQIADGAPVLSPSIARRIVDHFRQTGPVVGEDATLTAREREVLGLVGRGLRNADVATELEVAESTIASHIKAIYRKLGISSRAEASWHATRLGLHRDLSR